MEYFENRFNDPSFPFGFTNCFVAYEDTDEHDTLSDSVLGVIIGWHSGMDASYDFTTTPRLIRIVTEPSKPTSSLPYTMPGRTVMYLQSLESVFFRTIVDRLSGSKLLETYLRHMKKQYRINEVRLAHLEEDINVHRFFVHNKFNCYGSSIGFDGTPNPNIKTILCRRQI